MRLYQTLKLQMCMMGRVHHHTNPHLSRSFDIPGYDKHKQCFCNAGTRTYRDVLYFLRQLLVVRFQSRMGTILYVLHSSLKNPYISTNWAAGDTYASAFWAIIRGARAGATGPLVLTFSFQAFRTI